MSLFLAFSPVGRLNAPRSLTPSPPSQIRIEVTFEPLKDEFNCRINNFANFSLMLRWPWHFRKGQVWLFGRFIGRRQSKCAALRECDRLLNTRLRFIHISSALQVVLQHIYRRDDYCALQKINNQTVWVELHWMWYMSNLLTFKDILSFRSWKAVRMTYFC